MSTIKFFMPTWTYPENWDLNQAECFYGLLHIWNTVLTSYSDCVTGEIDSTTQLANQLNISLRLCLLYQMLLYFIVFFYKDLMFAVI